MVKHLNVDILQYYMRLIIKATLIIVVIIITAIVIMNITNNDKKGGVIELSKHAVESESIPRSNVIEGWTLSGQGILDDHRVSYNQIAWLISRSHEYESENYNSQQFAQSLHSDLIRHGYNAIIVKGVLNGDTEYNIVIVDIDNVDIKIDPVTGYLIPDDKYKKYFKAN